MSRFIDFTALCSDVSRLSSGSVSCTFVSLTCT